MGCCNEGHGHPHTCECGGGSQCGCDCGCCGSGRCECGCGGGGFRRRYQTKAEQIAELEGYLAELKAEVQAVEERLADLRQ